MHRAVVNTREIEKIIILPDYLKKFASLELIITPPHIRKKKEIKKRMADVFKKAKDIRIRKSLNIDELMNDMNDAIL